MGNDDAAPTAAGKASERLARLEKRARRLRQHPQAAVAA
jgi:hypothetical protein